MKTVKDRLRVVLLMTTWFIINGIVGVPFGVWWIITGRYIPNRFWDKYIKPIFESMEEWP